MGALRRLRIAAPATLALVIMIASLAAAPGREGLFGAALGLLMLAIAVIDARAYVIPNELSLVGFLLGLVHAASLAEPNMVAAVALSVLRAAALALAFLALRVGYRRVRGRQGLGLGDVKLAAVAGAWLDWSMMPVVVEIAALGALSYYLARSVVLRAPLSRTMRLPFGLFLAPSIWLTWLIEAMLFPV